MVEILPPRCNQPDQAGVPAATPPPGNGNNRCRNSSLADYIQDSITLPIKNAAGFSLLLVHIVGLLTIIAWIAEKIKLGIG